MWRYYVHLGVTADGQFCVALKPKFSKHVLVLNSVNIVEDVLSVNVNNCVVVLYGHIIIKGDANNVIAVANPFPE